MGEGEADATPPSLGETAANLSLLDFPWQEVLPLSDVLILFLFCVFGALIA